MENYSIVMLILGVMMALSAFADKLKRPYPVLLVTAGIALGFVPGMPQITISPEIIFLIFLPPMLYDAACNISVQEFKNNGKTINTLAFTVVFITTGGIALLAHYLMGMPWPLSFVLGAVLSATDAVAATSITKGLGLNHKTLTILEGESLINDASGLIAYRFAVAAVAGSSFIWYKAGGQFILLLAGGALIGGIAGKLLQFILHHTRQNGIVAISFTLLFPFVTYSLAEDLHVSGVIAVVVLGILTARLTSMYFPASTKAQSKAFWDIIVFILNGLVFILIGLEFPYVIHNVKSIQILPLIGYSFLIVFVTIAIRVVRIFLESRRHYLTFRKTGTDKHKKALLDWKTCLILGWSGMRGIVSLATALALPEKLDSGEPFPQRDTIIFIAVMVVVISLVFQGLTLPLLVRWLKIKPDGHRHKPQVV